MDVAPNQQTHHGKTQILRDVFGHVDQPPLGGGDQDEAVQGLKKGLVRRGVVRSLPRQESLEREERVQPHVAHISAGK